MSLKVQGLYNISQILEKRQSRFVITCDRYNTACRISHVCDQSTKCCLYFTFCHFKMLFCYLYFLTQLTTLCQFYFTKTFPSNYNDMKHKGCIKCINSSKLFYHQNARPAADTAKGAARAYLEQFVYELEDPYQMALVTYALTVANSNQRTNAFVRLEAMRRESRLNEVAFYKFLFK